MANNPSTPPRQLSITQQQTTWFKPYAGNAKLHPPAQVERIKQSITRFGFTNPILALPDGTVVAGHGRLVAAGHLGLATVPCIILEGMSATEARAYCLADNRLADLGSWDKEMLESELLALKDEAPDLLEAAGYTEDEVSQLIAEFDVKEAELPELDNGDKVPFQQRTFTMHNEQVEIVDAAIEDAKDKGLGLSAVNDNGNGNALYAICRHYLDNQNEG